MNNMKLIVPTLFGLEGLAGNELRRMGMEDVKVEDRRVFFTGDEIALAKANICLRTGERVMVVLAQFTAKSFEELFQGVYHANLEDYIPRDGQFPVKGHCLNSQLMSVSDCQAIIKKAASKRLGEKYGVSWLPETGVKFQLHFTILNDQVTLSLDTSGPGLNRTFAAQEYPWMPREVWNQVKEEAKDKEFHGKYQIVGSDADPSCVSLSFANARKAGVADCVTFKDGDATKMPLPTDSGIIVCNPPYGERMMEQHSAQRLYSALGRHLKFANTWKKYVITSEPEFEHYFGKRADKKRKFYNGKIQCNYYMFTDDKRKK